MSEGLTLVIGAGAAGLAAARMLHDEGRDVVVLEARDRLGGRAHTSFDIADHPVELGAEFIHGENVCTWGLLERFGLHSIDIHPRLDVRAFVDQQLLDQESFFRMPNATLFMKTPYAAKAWMDGGGSDISLAEAAPRWAGFYEGDPTPGQLRLWHNLISQLQAADPSEVGVGGLVEGSHDGDGGLILFRISEGYSALMEAMAAGLDVRLKCPVRHIEWSRDGVVAATDAGRFEARRAIVTVPLAVLKAKDVEFQPALPSQKVAAIEGLGAGPIAKIVLRFEERFWPEGMTNLFTTLDSQGWWTSGAGRDNEAPVITSLLGGSAVGRLRSCDDPAAEGVRHLEQVFGRSVADRVVESHWIDWSADPWSKMGYSSVPPGGVGLRDALAAPVDDVLHFAGEATSVLRPACVHGAIESGYRAASEAIQGSKTVRAT